MALEQKLRLKLSQRLVMTPSLQQAIKLLQLSRIELEETLAQEILENPILDVEEQHDEGSLLDGSDGPDGPDGAGVDSGTDTTVEHAGDGTAEATSLTAATTATEGAATEGTATEDTATQPAAEEPSAEEKYDDIDVEAFFADYLADSRMEGPSLTTRSSDDPGFPLENLLSSSPGLYDHLEWQLHMISCPETLTGACEFIIGNLDEDGFLRASDDELFKGTGLDAQQLEQALAIVRSLDPPGIAARTLQECLLWQVESLLKDAGPEEMELLQRVWQLIEGHWDDLLHQKWGLLASALGCEIAQIKPLLDVIHRLEPKPGRAYSNERNIYIEPDVHVRKLDGEYVVTLNDDGMPRLRVNSHYARMLEGSAVDANVSSYLREKMRNAVWLMKSIDQRQRTIYKVARSIVSFQRDFLDHGIERLKPMVLRQVAEDIGMHESTISRVVSNKYMYTPRGLYPMKFFFHSGVDSARGENVSSLVVKERIRKLVEAEDPVRPLSDSKIMKLLQREGVRLARRTVAKYREELGIRSSDKRKKVF